MNGPIGREDAPGLDPGATPSQRFRRGTRRPRGSIGEREGGGSPADTRINDINKRRGGEVVISPVS